jgi:hypothetical protein
MKKGRGCSHGPFFMHKKSRGISSCPRLVSIYVTYGVTRIKLRWQAGIVEPATTKIDYLYVLNDS